MPNDPRSRTVGRPGPDRSGEEGRRLPARAGPRVRAAVRLQLSFPGTALSVRKVLQTVRTGLEPLALDPEETGTIELVLAEALNNVVEHAYPPEARGWITLNCHIAPDGLHVSIRDKGRPMPDGGPPLGQTAPLPETLDTLPEGGFGWFLIRDLSRDIRYSRQDDTNELCFRINLHRAEATAPGDPAP
ncbi:ATP-binding protein [Pseudooceanicola sp. CBS1P-1]|uniref:ATP-binding protein n=1 Tax=Pseudooceanicola albus TaxID=2692189 RepID=A0A6L7GBG3_9RHOB|nr:MULTISPECIES: ATP-binding protein [Pseudooceanicola]MBT9386681.1 ATP-binding protein [Pseudooceanicola endophyticus]MXN20907.1 ATP-binding protein [Pseudooceanicola albus]